jgi:hypothetical protein
LEFSSYKVYEDGTVDSLVDLMPSFLGLAASKKRSAALFRELVEGKLLNHDESWTKTYVIGTEVFTKKILGWSSRSSDPPI